MAIQPGQPIIIPEKTADTLWVSSLCVEAPNLTTPVSVAIKLLPYNSQTGETFPTCVKDIRIDDLFSAAAGDEVLANAITVLFAAIQKLSDDRALFGTPAPAEPPVEPPV